LLRAQRQAGPATPAAIIVLRSPVHDVAIVILDYAMSPR
jgi:hypothetical protein